MDSNKIKGLELSRKYFEEIYLPVIKSEFLEVFEKTFGKESNNYKNILENIEIVKEKMV